MSSSGQATCIALERHLSIISQIKVRFQQEREGITRNHRKELLKLQREVNAKAKVEMKTCVCSSARSSNNVRNNKGKDAAIQRFRATIGTLQRKLQENHVKAFPTMDEDKHFEIAAHGITQGREGGADHAKAETPMTLHQALIRIANPEVSVSQIPSTNPETSNGNLKNNRRTWKRVNTSNLCKNVDISRCRCTIEVLDPEPTSYEEERASTGGYDEAEVSSDEEDFGNNGEGLLQKAAECAVRTVAAFSLGAAVVVFLLHFR